MITHILMRMVSLMRTIYGAISEIESMPFILCTMSPMDRIGYGVAFHTVGTSPFPGVIHAKTNGKELLVM